MKVFSAVLWHESNSFSPLPTSLASYREVLLHRPATGEGAEAWDRVQKLAPIALYARERGHDVVQGLAALANPSGPTARSTYEGLRDELLADLGNAGRVDAVLLFLHGAQMAEGYDDCEGDLLGRVRDIVGPGVFVGTLLDLHCNITPAMVTAADALVPCKEYPHTDWPDRSRELVRMAESAVAGQIRPTTVFQPVPMLGHFHTTRQPLRSFVDELTALEGRNDVLAANLVHGFAFSDQPHTGAGVLLVVDGDRRPFVPLALDLGRRFFGLRQHIASSHPSLDEALDEVQRLLDQHPDGPIVLADTSDNPGGGAPGDSTFVLRKLLDRGMRRAAVATLWDPVAVKIAFDAGAGARLRMRIGGKLGELSGAPLDLDVTVKCLNEAATQASFAPGLRASFGRCAAVEAAGIEIVLATLRQQAVSPDCFSELGIDPRARRLLVVKSAQHFHAKFAPIAARILYCDAPGYVDSHLGRLPFTRLRRPIWPLDPVPLSAYGETWS